MSYFCTQKTISIVQSSSEHSRIKTKKTQCRLRCGTATSPLGGIFSFLKQNENKIQDKVSQKMSDKQKDMS